MKKFLKTAMLLSVLVCVALGLSACGSEAKDVGVDLSFTSGIEAAVTKIELSADGNEWTTVYNDEGAPIEKDSATALSSITVNTGKKDSYSLRVQTADSEVVVKDIDLGSLSNNGKLSLVLAQEDGKYIVSPTFTSKFDLIVLAVDDFVWGMPLIILIIVTGVYLTIRTRFVQVRHLGKALKFMVKNEEGGKGEVTSFAALCTALSATIGTGNIVGVATAIAAGGPGALLWMLIAAFFGMATKYAEGFLAIKYRTVDEDGHALGGPFYYIERGIKERFPNIPTFIPKILAVLFAIFGVLVGIMGIGTITQINGIASAVQNFFDPNSSNIAFTLGANSYTWAVVITAIVVTIAVGLVVIGGIKRISKVSEIIVPFMAVLYVGFAVILLVCNITRIPQAVSDIVQGAFMPQALFGGVMGYTIKVAMQKGVARGIFSNEAGLGSAPIAAAAAKTNDTVRQGLVTMTGTFIDTIIICTMTGLSIVISGSYLKPELKGVAITTDAFQTGLSGIFGNGSSVPAFILMLCLVFFAFTTILGWDYYSERCLEYLCGKNRHKKGILMSYKWLYILFVFIGPFLTVEAVWNIADTVNGLMAVPNVIALILLAGIISKETRSYGKKLKPHKESKKTL